jgi:light-regulated signal transduction histidine kinase (bacteriophytochrome)
MRAIDMECEDESVHLVSLRDITERVRVEKELRQFAYVTSHNLQEPLCTVASYVQLLAQRYRGMLDADGDDSIAYAMDEINHMQDLAKDLLIYSRIGTNGAEFMPVSCKDVLDRALASLRIMIEENKAVVTYGSLPTVMADSSQLAQLFQDLISNAIKFHNEEPPRVHVSASQKRDEWIFAIRDNGIGMDPEYADRIFVIFQRLHSREEFPGTGIGLAICRRIVDYHGGKIWVESQPGAGATFCFTLPIR